MPYFLKGLLVVLAFVVTRIIRLTRRHRKEKDSKTEQNKTEKK